MLKKTLYVNHIGAVLTKDGQRFIIRSKERVILKEYPVIQISQIVLIGNIQITGSALDLIIREKIDTVFMTRRGRFKARLDLGITHFSKLRIKQYKQTQNLEIRMKLAKKFVIGKLKNQKVLLVRRSRTNKELLKTPIGRIEMAIEQANKASNIEQLMGYEGSGARAYFEGFKICLGQDLGFKKRGRRPPPDPVNALLSFGYTLLFHYCHGAIQRAGLDPHLGYLHEIADRKPSLTLDLMEEFRPVIVDTVVLTAINRMEFSVKDFKKADKGFHMTKEALAKFVSSIESRLEDRTGATQQSATTFRRALHEQARQMVNVVLEECKEYKPLLWR